MDNDFEVTITYPESVTDYCYKVSLSQSLPSAHKRLAMTLPVTVTATKNLVLQVEVNKKIYFVMFGSLAMDVTIQLADVRSFLSEIILPGELSACTYLYPQGVSGSLH